MVIPKTVSEDIPSGALYKLEQLLQCCRPRSEPLNSFSQARQVSSSRGHCIFSTIEIREITGKTFPTGQGKKTGVSSHHTGTKVMADLFEPFLLVPDCLFRVPDGAGKLLPGTRGPSLQIIGLDQEVP